MSDLGELAPVPAGSVLLHIGPHKTGTTALQNALRAARDDLLAQGVRYAGTRSSRDAEAARHAIGRRTVRDEATAEAAAAAWREVRDRLNDASVPRRAFSSESLANADDQGAARVVGDLGPAEVVITVRALADVLPSQYSQFVQRGLATAEYPRWVEAVLARDESVPTVRAFWRRHSHDAHVRRWGAVVGMEHVTVLVVDDRDRDFLPAAFERLLALRPGTLAERIGRVRANRSLTAAETELVRRWHLECAAAGLDREQVRRWTWRACDRLRAVDPRPTAPRLALPAWAVEQANARAAEAATSIAASGARVVGDLGRLSAATARPGAITEPVRAIDTRLAADFAVGLALHSDAQVAARLATGDA
ncbi:hypothetical protein [Nocardioides sp.]|uniref:hypothetical protein n=1 Tax=Nocardioides sp. TaxID=35761 RepID=UPI002C1694FC|nr:hypothetical protein [Nocardioides sp.]HVX55532.1 hypothetical protein [Nocardioides sp.]